ncbi:uncharacterized protein J7T54_005526 [Emericellopsis cladophorae]|uniref:Xylanolytic transcriptional activator regulatory domain-containing protein n=1 Tax=Emericellopsis cladophorae TaxID=2686198 RepID=A0A9Q0BF17_9HYPO|nr:uncharacterized protein J7T54_005526 [Emericellopsis cladophorae]KAI6783497.1 hypothetical protein J7T54_005526 [Emericellopsis cladophorae]
MSAANEGQDGDANGPITYPSPNADTGDAGPFYNTASQEHMDEPEDRKQPFDDEDDVAQAQDHHNHDQDHNLDGQHQEHQHHEHMQTEMHQHDAEGSQQQNGRPPNIEELQLAAQLGHTIASTPLLPSTDPNMNTEDSNLRHIMPHPEHQPEHQQPAPEQQHHEQPSEEQPQPQQHHHQQQPPPPEQHHDIPQQQQQQQQHHHHNSAYMQGTPTSESMLSHGLPVSINAQLQPWNPLTSDNVPPRKRYIKELADRINSIESKLETDGGLTSEDLSGLFGDRPLRQSNSAEESGRKRPYSSISGGDMGSPLASRNTPWGPRQLPSAQNQADMDATESYNSASLAPQPLPIPSHDHNAAEAAMDLSLADWGDGPAVEEGVFQDYLSTLQTLYPILPSNLPRMQELLQQCPHAVRTAFAHALLAVAQSSSGNVRLASTLLAGWESEESPRTPLVNLVHVQTLLLLIIDADWRGSPSMPYLMGRAVVLANDMKLWTTKNLPDDLPPDSQDALCIRVWWSLILMDRWHAVATGKPVLIPDHSAVVPRGLDTVLNETCFHLVRLSNTLGAISEVSSSLPPGVTVAEAAVASILLKYVEQYRQDLPDHVVPSTHPLVHLAYWHCRLAVTLLSPKTTTPGIMWPMEELIKLLSANADMRNPLANHFGGLVILSLSRLLSHEDSREKATTLIRDLSDRPGGVWDGIRDKLSDLVRPTSSSGDVTLQHLADLATASTQDEASANDMANGDEASVPMTLD